MKSLHEEVRERRAAESAVPTCVSAEPGGGPGLVVCQWRGESWALPWSQFTGARLGGTDSDTQLEIAFANHIVTVTGDNLAGLLEDLAAQRVGRLRDLPAQHRPATASEAPFIVRIDVQIVSEGRRTERREPPGEK